MPRGGQNKKPTQLKVLQGTNNPSRENHNEPQPELAIPKPRKTLSRREKKEYKRLSESCYLLGVLTEVDGLELEMCAIELAKYHEFTEYLEREGYTYEAVTAAGNIVFKARPEVAMRNEAFKNTTNLLARFGLDPVNRSRVSALPEKKGSKWDKF